jgi:hypothetical protein
MILVSLCHLKFLDGICRLWCRNFKWAALGAFPLAASEGGGDERAMFYWVSAASGVERQWCKNQWRRFEPAHPPAEKCFTMRRLCGRDLSFGTGTERIAPESLTPGVVLLRSPQHIAQVAFIATRSSLPPVFKRRFDDEILNPHGAPESNQKRSGVNRDSSLPRRPPVLCHGRARPGHPRLTCCWS